MFAGCVVYSDYQNGNLSDFGTYLAAAISGAIVGALLYGLAIVTINLIPYVAKVLNFVAVSKGIPLLHIYGTTIATAGGYTLAATNTVRLTNFLVSGITGQENVLVNIFFEEGSTAYNNALNVYNEVASFLNYANAAYFTLGATSWIIDKASRFNINQKPVVTNEKLKNAIDDIYKGQGGSNTVGNGTTMDAVRNEIRTGQPTNGRFHSIKAQELINRLQRRLRAGDLNASEIEIIKKLIEDLQNALNGN